MKKILFKYQSQTKSWFSCSDIRSQQILLSAWPSSQNYNHIITISHWKDKSYVGTTRQTSGMYNTVSIAEAFKLSLFLTNRPNYFASSARNYDDKKIFKKILRYNLDVSEFLYLQDLMWKSDLREQTITVDKLKWAKWNNHVYRASTNCYYSIEFRGRLIKVIVFISSHYNLHTNDFRPKLVAKAI